MHSGILVSDIKIDVKKVIKHFVWAGMSLILPYLTLQALGLGLTYEDISIIYGISPVIALTAGPVAGKQLKLECTKALWQGLPTSFVKVPLAGGQNQAKLQSCIAATQKEN